MQRKTISPNVLIDTVMKNRSLIYSLIKREVKGRYRSSIMGVLWSFLNPMLMLGVYTFAFSVVFKAHWMGAEGSTADFALIVFAGLMVFNWFLESLNRAPLLVVGNVNFVKKVVFPLEILPIVALGTATFHLLINVLVWLIFCFIFWGTIHASIILLPIVLLPLVFVTLGVAWFLSSLGVYLRDLPQIISVLSQILMYLSPIFYSLIIIPEKYRIFVRLSPLTMVIEHTRDVMVWGHSIDILPWVIELGLSLVIAWLGFAWFQSTRMGFADVL